MPQRNAADRSRNPNKEAVVYAKLLEVGRRRANEVQGSRYKGDDPNRLCVVVAGMRDMKVLNRRTRWKWRLERTTMELPLFLLAAMD